MKRMKKVLVGGSFNLVHQGHILFLKKAKELGNYLVVIIASDKTVIKNKKVLMFPAEKRKKIVEALSIADRVKIGDNIDFFRVVEEERPDIIALGYDQKMDQRLVKKIKEAFPKCRFVRIRAKLKGYSTSKMLREFGIKESSGANSNKSPNQ